MRPGVYLEKGKRQDREEEEEEEQSRGVDVFQIWVQNKAERQDTAHT